jgi:hypothetical protein
MIKKIIHIVLSFLLLISTAGISFSKHYCNDRLISVSIYEEAEPCCDGDNRCCTEETENYRLDSVYDAVEILQIEKNQDYLIRITYLLIDYLLVPVADSGYEYLVPESPPPLSQQEILSSLQTYLC